MEYLTIEQFLLPTLLITLLNICTFKFQSLNVNWLEIEELKEKYGFGFYTGSITFDSVYVIYIFYFLYEGFLTSFMQVLLIMACGLIISMLILIPLRTVYFFRSDSEPAPKLMNLFGIFSLLVCLVFIVYTVWV